MTCIIVDDEPLGRKAIELLVRETPALTLAEQFGDAESAGAYMATHPVDLVFLDIRMPGTDGLEFARTIRHDTLVIFTTAFPEYAVDSYELDAVDYLVKPVEAKRFRKAVDKAADYLQMLQGKSQKNSLTAVTSECIFVKSDRRYFKLKFSDIQFIEGLKDYVVIRTTTQKLITKVTLKAIYDQLPKQHFMRTGKSYIVNLSHIDSFDSNDIYIGTHELAIGSAYRDEFMERIGFFFLQ